MTLLRFGVCVAVAFVSLEVVALAEADEKNVLQGSVRAHDPSSVHKEGDRYYVFTTGWGLRSKHSPDLTNWTAGPPVFTAETAPGWVEDVAPGFRGHYWAPDLVRWGDGYRLYYSVSRFGKQTSAIGLATTPTLSPDDSGYGWSDAGVVLQSREGDPYNAIDPSVLVDTDGRHWMAFGSYWQGIHLIELDPETGLRRDTSVEPIRLAGAEQIEAATLLRRGEAYYLFVNHGECCRGVESTYRILVGRSDHVEGPYVDRDGRALTDGGGTVVLESDGARIGPGHVAPLADEEPGRFAFHYYDGDDRGRSKLALADWRWSPDGWPAAVDVKLAGEDTDPRFQRPF